MLGQLASNGEGSIKYGAGVTTDISSNLVVYQEYKNSYNIDLSGNNVSFSTDLPSFVNVALTARGILTLLGNDTSGFTVSPTSTIQVRNGGAIGSMNGGIDNGMILFNRSDTYTFSGGILGAGSINQIGMGTLILINNNSYSGSTILTRGTIEDAPD